MYFDNKESELIEYIDNNYLTDWYNLFLYNLKDDKYEIRIYFEDNEDVMIGLKVNSFSLVNYLFNPEPIDLYKLKKILQHRLQENGILLQNENLGSYVLE